MSQPLFETVTPEKRLKHPAVTPYESTFTNSKDNLKVTAWQGCRFLPHPRVA